jgi:creatinine deaminase
VAGQSRGEDLVGLPALADTSHPLYPYFVSPGMLYTTLMPCFMCAGTIVQFKIPKVVVGESRTFGESKEFLESHGVEVVILDLDECVQMMEAFIAAEPELWNEDIMEL